MFFKHFVSLRRPTHTHTRTSSIKIDKYDKWYLWYHRSQVSRLKPFVRSSRSRINHAACKDMRLPERYQHRGQSSVDPSNTNHTNGLRFKRIDIRNFVNERQQIFGGRQQQRAPNGHQIPFKGCSNFTNGQAAFVNGHVPLNNHQGCAGNETTINGHPTTVNEHHPSANNAARGPSANGYRNIMTGCRNGLFINKMVIGDDLIKPSRISNGVKSNVKSAVQAKGNDNSRKHARQAVANGDNNKRRNDRLVNCQNAINGRLGARKEMEKETFGIPTDLRQILKPTVQKRQEIFKVDYDPEDMNGPYNFRQLLRPAEYLPTESLRKRKGGLACNGAPPSKDELPKKHVKRRAPLAPNQNKLVNGKK